MAYVNENSGFLAGLTSEISGILSEIQEASSEMDRASKDINIKGITGQTLSRLQEMTRGDKETMERLERLRNQIQSYDSMMQEQDGKLNGKAGIAVREIKSVTPINSISSLKAQNSVDQCMSLRLTCGITTGIATWIDKALKKLKDIFKGLSETEIKPVINNDGKTKTATYGKNNYKVVCNYNGETIYQRNYDRLFMNGNKNEGCTACCAYIAYKMRGGTLSIDEFCKKYTVSKNNTGFSTAKLNELGFHYPEEAPKGYGDTDPDGTKRLNMIEKAISEGKMVMLRVAKKGSSSGIGTHHVLVVGIKDPHNTPITQDDLLVVDPASQGNEPKPLTSTNYRIAKKEENNINSSTLVCG